MEWISVRGGKYAVSNTGLVKRIDKDKIMRHGINHKGYLHVSLCENGKSSTCLIHRLVAKAFLPNPNNKRTVNHINGIKTDNRIENLEWATDSENQLHAHALGLKSGFWKGKYGKNNTKSKPVLQYDKEMNLIKRWENAEEAGRKGYSPSTIRKCCLGLLKTHKKHFGSMKENLITDEMVEAFINETFYKRTSPDFHKKWSEFKANYQPRQEEWEVVALRMKSEGIIEKYCEALLYHPDFEIYKVRRLSDGAVLEVGKEYEIEFRTGSKVKDKIVSIGYIDGELYYYFDSEYGNSIKDITSITEVKTNPVLFTTFDGEEIREGDSYFYVRPSEYACYSCNSASLSYNKGVVNFSTREAAENYIIEHKPDKSWSMIRDGLVAQGFSIKRTNNLIEEIERGLDKIKYS